MISDISVDIAPTAKRIQFQSMGRIFRIRKRHCHLTVKIEGEMDVADVLKAARKKAKKTDEVESGTPSEKTTAKKKTSAKKTAAKAKKAKVEKKPAKKTTKKATPKKGAASGSGSKIKTTKADSGSKAGKES